MQNTDEDNVSFAYGFSPGAVKVPSRHGYETVTGSLKVQTALSRRLLRRGKANFSGRSLFALDIIGVYNVLLMDERCNRCKSIASVLCEWRINFMGWYYKKPSYFSFGYYIYASVSTYFFYLSISKSSRTKLINAITCLSFLS